MLGEIEKKGIATQRGAELRFHELLQLSGSTNLFSEKKFNLIAPLTHSPPLPMVFLEEPPTEGFYVFEPSR